MKAIDAALVVALLLFFSVPLVTVFAHRSEAVFSFLAADTFYYLTVARNVREHGIVSFDQVNPVNCFQPLWQSIVVSMGWLPLDEFEFVAAELAATLLICAAAIGVFWRALRRFELSFPMGLALLPCGVYGLIVDPAFHNLWAYSNGMETAVSLLGYALLVHVLLGWKGPHLPPRQALVFGGILALLVLARLDSAFFLPAFLMVCLLGAWRTGSAAVSKGGVIAVLVPSAVVAVYLLVSQWYFGTALPVSGSVKTTFPWVNTFTLAMVRDEMMGASAHPSAQMLWVPQLLIPLGFAAAMLTYEALRLRKAGSDGWSSLILVSGLYVLSFHLYNLLFVSINHQGFWYFAISTTFMFLSVIALFERHLDRAGRSVNRVINIAILFCAVGGTWNVADSYVNKSRPYGWVSDTQAAIFASRSELRQQTAGGSARIYALDDGIFAYSTGLPTVNGTGLCLDPGSRQSSQAGTLGAHLRGMGVTHVFVPRNYLPFLGDLEKGPFLRYDALRPVSEGELIRVQQDMAWLGDLSVKKVHTSFVLFELSGGSRP